MEITLPQAFLDRMKGMLGKDYEAFLASYDKPRHPALRVNPLKISPEDFQRLAPYDLEPVPWAVPNGFYYDPEARPGKSPYHEAGLYYIQEPSAMAVAALSGTRPGERVLDLCAAPGGKSTQLAGMLEGRGLLVSNEIHPQRARILSRNIERLGIRNAIVTNEAPEDLSGHFPGFFDRIIVDAPCSGEGMFRKEEEAIPNWSPENVALCARRQAGILDQADLMLKAGGVLVYSTCTFAPAEDEESIQNFLERHPDYEEVDLPEKLGSDLDRLGFAAGSDGKSIRLWPHKLDGEGHFLAVLKKAGGDVDDSNIALHADGDSRMGSDAGLQAAFESDGKIEAKAGKKKKKAKKNRDRKGADLYDSEAAKLWKEFSQEAFSDYETEGRLRQFGQDLYLLPEDLNLDSIRVLRAGLHLGTVKKNRFEPDHALVLALKKEELQQTLNLSADSEEVKAYLRGESIPCTCKGWTAVLVDGYTLGWGKASGGVLKNHYPKGLRMYF
ncbi:MAG: RsmB/NOP family class I SAM-dependent RNA methyltransferase [Lachnospiraceae bacterium]|nr:RsmB/NOP family class I SAM-dependent RNA methyltransferase [Lachnospiraceae bacterium]